MRSFLPDSKPKPFHSNLQKLYYDPHDKSLHKYEFNYAEPLAFDIANGITGFVVNVAFILIYVWNARLRTTNYLLMLNISITNLIYILIYLPIQISNNAYAFEAWPYGVVACKLFHYLRIIVNLSTVYSLLMMALDRFFAICFSSNGSSLIDRCFKPFVLYIIWIGVAVYSAPVMILFSVKEWEGTCGYNDDAFDESLFNRIVLRSSFQLPIGLIHVIFVIILGCIVFKTNKKISLERQKKEDRYMAFVVYLMSFIYSLLWLPFNLLKDDGVIYEKYIISMAYMMAYSSFSVLPIVYISMVKDVRFALWKENFYSSVTAEEETKEEQVMVEEFHYSKN